VIKSNLGQGKRGRSRRDSAGRRPFRVMGNKLLTYTHFLVHQSGRGLAVCKHNSWMEEEEEEEKGLVGVVMVVGSQKLPPSPPLAPSPSQINRPSSSHPCVGTSIHPPSHPLPSLPPSLQTQAHMRAGPAPAPAVEGKRHLELGTQCRSSPVTQATLRCIQGVTLVPAHSPFQRLVVTLLPFHSFIHSVDICK
jgi:hypothetical protein